MKNGRRWLVVVSLCLGLGAPGRAWAQLPAGGEFQINSYTTGDQLWPDVAMDANGDFVVVWDSYGQDGSVSGLQQRRYRSDGTPKAGGLPVNTHTTNQQTRPAVAMDAAGNFVVAWMSGGQDGSGYGIVAQRYDTSGAAQGGELVVNSYTTGSQVNPGVALDGSGNFVVVWSSFEQDGSSTSIRARRFDAQGAPLTPDFQVNTYTTGYQIQSAVASAPSGSFVVVWSSNGQDGDNYGVFGQRYDASGTPLGSEFRVNGYTPGRQWLPDVASDASGGFVVVWQSDGQDGSAGGVFARRYDPQGAPLGAGFAVNEHTTAEQGTPRVAVAPDGSFTVVWSTFAHPGGSGSDPVGRRFDASGAPVGGDFRINTYTSSYQSGAAIAADPDGDFVVAWSSQGADGDGYGISGQRYGDLIFQDNFESDGVSRWSASITDGTDLDVTGGAGLGGTTLGMRALVDDTAPSTCRTTARTRKPATAPASTSIPTASTRAKPAASSACASSSPSTARASAWPRSCCAGSAALQPDGAGAPGRRHAGWTPGSSRSRMLRT